MGDLDKIMEEEMLSSILKSINTGEFSVSSFQVTLFDLLERRNGKYIIEALLQAEADISAQISGSSTPEQMCISNTHKHIVQLLVNSTENYNFYDGKGNRTVLHFASKYGWLEVVQSLLKKGADPNVKDFYGDTPLMLATQSLHKGVAQLLTESGADISCCSSVDYTLLHAASEKGWLAFLQSLLNTGIDPNTATKSGFTPLDFAVQGSNKVVVSLLIESGANLNRCKLSRKKVLDFAAREGHLQVLQYFIEKATPTFALMFRLIDIGNSHEQVEIVEYVAKTVIMMFGIRDTPFQFLVNSFNISSKLIHLFIEKGAYFDSLDAIFIFDVLKVSTLKNIQICTQAIINKFNNKYLPDLYKLPLPFKKLPPIENLTIKSQEIVQDIEQSVGREIETSGYCNVVKPRVILLSMMSVKSYIDYYNDLKKRSQLKRSATVDSDDQSQPPRKMAMLRRCSVHTPI